MKTTTITLAAALLAATTQAGAQGWLGESVPWQFQTSADRANRALVNDLVEKKKGGYYDSFKSTYITNIDRQINCNFQPTSAGNSSSTDQANSVASPQTNASSGTSANSTGSSNQSSDNLGRGGNTASNNQSNTGTISSGVSGSPSTTTTAPINSDHANGHQDMQVAQNNSGHQTTSVSGSTGCSFASGALN